jgi:murein DD-endopeptidase MepM/ murein hydrolase activator NlpD
MINKFFILFSIMSLLWLPGKQASAQEESESTAYYVIQYGDTLWDLAIRFRVTVDQLVAVNGLANSGQINVGDQLKIPGLEGIQGRLVTYKVPYGESLRSLSRRYQVPEETLAFINRLSSPHQLYAGFDLIIPEDQAATDSGRRSSLRPGESYLELALRENINPYLAAYAAPTGHPWEALPGDILRLPGEDTGGPGIFPDVITGLEVNTREFTQGKVIVIHVEADSTIEVAGLWQEKEIIFFDNGGGSYWALQGIHALLQPGAYPLSLQIRMNDGSQYKFSQLAYVRSGGYPQAPDLTVEEATLDPSVNQPENLRWAALAAPATPQRLWEGLFTFPSPRIYLEQYTARFGERRTYNAKPELYFHTGLDVAGQTGTEVYAAAPGTVVFAEELFVRGNAIMINHGWGVYTAYMHLSEFRVGQGDQVEAGQLIGLVGNTGRSSGSHLHWEVIVGGVQVDPLDWLQRTFP